MVLRVLIWEELYANIPQAESSAPVPTYASAENQSLKWKVPLWKVYLFWMSWMCDIVKKCWARSESGCCSRAFYLLPAHVGPEPVGLWLRWKFIRHWHWSRFVAGGSRQLLLLQSLSETRIRNSGGRGPGPPGPAPRCARAGG